MLFSSFKKRLHLSLGIKSGIITPILSPECPLSTCSLGAWPLSLPHSLEPGAVPHKEKSGVNIYDICSSLQFRVCCFRQWRPLTRRQSPSPGLALQSSSHPNHFIRVLLETEIPQLSRLLRCWQFVFVPFVYFSTASDTHVCRDWGLQTPGHTLLAGFACSHSLFIGRSPDAGVWVGWTHLGCHSGQ